MVRFVREGDSLRAAISSPDLLLLDQPLDSVRFDAPRVRFTTPDEFPLRFEGVLEGNRIRGGAAVPAVLGVVERGPGVERALRFELRRAAPAPPPPYTEREVRFAGAGVRLASTLLAPTGGGDRRPGIVVLQGSSSNLRREDRFYADHFARAGLAVLTFDKRGEGGSSGDYGAASYDDLAADAAAAVERLRAQPEVDPRRVGIWGLSQGAFIAAMVAARVPEVAFVVAVSPPGTPPAEAAAYQDSVRVARRGFPVEEAARAAALHRRIAAWLRTGEGEAELASALARDAAAPWRRATALPARLPDGPAREGWYWRGRILDPLPFWRTLKPPVLVVFGAADELLPAATSAGRIERALREKSHPDARVLVFPEANHVLRRLPPAAGRWNWPRAAPGYLDRVTAWIVDHAR